MSIGHVGHLVPISRASAGWTAALNPENWTVFNFDKAREAGAAVHEFGREQALLARVVGDGDRYYRGHEGGFAADEILRVAETIDGLAGARCGGVTTFPALLFDAASGSVRPTPSGHTAACSGVSRQAWTQRRAGERPGNDIRRDPGDPG
jgi:predicted amino acid racemase